jgi:type I restriction enzyme M protein
MKKNTKSVSMADAIWKILDECLHLVFKRSELGDAIFPFITLRRMDCLLADVNEKVRATNEQMKDKIDAEKLDLLLRKVAGGRRFYNTSRFTLESLLEDAPNIEVNFRTYINGYNQEVVDVLNKYQFQNVVAKLTRNKLLFKLIDQICSNTFDIASLTDMEMGDCFEEIIRLANEGNGETAGEHFTPRDAIYLMSAVLFRPHADQLARKGIIRSIYDPTCGTGGMVNIGRKFIREELCSSPEEAPTIYTYGQELNETAYAIAKSEALMTGADTSDIRLGDTLSEDQFPTEHFDYMMANPPYGINWTKEKEFVQSEALNPFGRFSAGLPAISDGQLLFLQHMISKMSPNGSRIGVVTNGSPLFSGAAGSGESNIRKWIIENDWLETIIALPKDMFYNTPISTYIWILDNKKTPERKGKVQLINATKLCKSLTKSLGNKRNTIEDSYEQIYEAYAAFKESDICRIYDNEDFGYLVLTVEQPLRDEKSNPILKKGQLQPDKSKRTTERVALKRDAKEYFQKEVLPHVDPQSWLDIPSTKIGYEINFTRYFYEYKAPEKSEVIKERLTNKEMLQEIQNLFNAIFED